MTGMNAANVIIPGRGAIFTADPLTAAPSYKTMSPDVPGAGWTCLGHTSIDNSVALSKDGGDPTSYDSWWTAALAVTYASTSWSVSVGALQMDAGVLDLAFNGSLDTDGGYIVPSSVVAVEKALFVLALQGTKRMGLYLPKVSITLGDAPSFDPTKIFEIPLSAAVLSDDTTLMKWYHPGLEAGPIITSVSPVGSAAGGATVTLTGSGFTGATAVEFGGVAGTTLNVVSDLSITVKMPGTGAASTPIVVKTPLGNSTPTTYARTA